jgi:hypothetical protein
MNTQTNFFLCFSIRKLSSVLSAQIMSTSLDLKSLTADELQAGIANVETIFTANKIVTNDLQVTGPVAVSNGVLINGPVTVNNSLTVNGVLLPAETFPTIAAMENSFQFFVPGQSIVCLSNGTDNVQSNWIVSASGLSDLTHIPLQNGLTADLVESTSLIVNALRYNAQDIGETLAFLITHGYNNLKLLPRTYGILSTVTLANNTVLEGAPGVIFQVDNAKPDTRLIVSDSVSNVLVRYIDIVFDVSYTVLNFTILNFRSQNCTYEHVSITQAPYIAFGASNSYKTIYRNCNVAFTKNNAIGFWSNTFPPVPFPLSEGAHEYLDCIAKFCQLDGLDLGAPNCIVRGGEYSNNGTGTNISAAGIFTLDQTFNFTVDGVIANSNSDAGIGIGINHGAITNCLCTLNGLSGIALGASHHVTVTNCDCHNNGNSPFPLPLPVFPRDGISFTDGASFITIVGNQCYDDRGAAAKQNYGVGVGFNGVGTDVVTVVGNTLKYNLIDGSNLEPGDPNLPTNLVYESNND